MKAAALKVKSIKILLLSFIILSVSVNTRANNDSLLNTLSQDIPDTMKVLNLNQVATSYLIKDTSLAVKYLKRSIKLADKINYIDGKARAYKLLGSMYYYQSKYNLAIAEFKIAKATWEEGGYSKQVGSILFNLGVISVFMNNHDDGLNYYFQALEIFDKLDDTLSLSKCYNAIGILYHEQQEYQKEYEYLAKSLKYAREIESSYDIAEASMNLGNLFLYQKAYDSSLLYYTKSLEFFENLNRPDKVSSNLTNIGYIKYGQKKYEEALEYHKRALKIQRSINDMRNMANTLKGIGESYLELSEFDSSRYYLEESKKLAKRYNPSELKDVYNMLAVTYAKVDNYKEAYFYQSKHIQLKDSITNRESLDRIRELEEKENQRQLEKTRMKEERAEERRNTLQYSGILIFIVFLFIIVFLSGRFTLPVRVAEGAIFFTFILLFEFVLVLLDPYIDEYSGGVPIIKLLANAALALMIFPLHSFFEEKLKQRVVRKKKED